MKLDDFIKELHAAGWRSPLDAQHENIKKLFEKLPLWRPISTVPKDGTVIDLMHKNGGRITDEWWTEDECFTCLLGTDHFSHWKPIEF